MLVVCGVISKYAADARLASLYVLREERQTDRLGSHLPKPRKRHAAEELFLIGWQLLLSVPFVIAWRLPDYSNRYCAGDLCVPCPVSPFH